MDSRTFLDTLSKRLSLDKEQTKNLSDCFSKVVGDCCADLRTVAIPGFGSFEPKKRLERVNQHPATGKRMLLPPKVVVSFRPSAVLKNKLKASGDDAENVES